MTRNRLLVAAAVVAALVVVFLLVRPAAEQEAATTTPPTVEPAPEETEQGQTETEPPPPPDDQRLVIRIANGEPVGGIHRLTVSRGERVIIEVRSDQADELHVHGYDLTQEIAPQVPARLAFDADLTGRFEIELHSTHRQIGELTVQP